ncbi:hypothetical protein A6M27_07175 [Acidithiobacillus thiooxidans]|uniref:Uncharacterized protein n=1 Tax=Acidithiobacillus thiooxidans TaxID=930 RepID=A0A1C2JJW9_ACITH|nr:hypothetical protein A6P07_07695 [Acidithiobacillus thiooxidans]OCX77090.1 hypothetical protein A6O24_07400 [Acidithiobacillus thiooxidans]OCX85701.1 hypothetical protein A6O26_00335 [Acidithiobacillus thiooxidans]OCX88511.1 hypothetical protein A6M27_07175 [Acidithiobacillus thiooxidans]OFC44834.1 hypothetical protein BAE47_11185 [Acidithiobacillus thiooxidans]
MFPFLETGRFRSISPSLCCFQQATEQCAFIAFQKPRQLHESPDFEQGMITGLARDGLILALLFLTQFYELMFGIIGLF